MRFLWYTPTEYCRFSPFEIGIGVKRCNAGEYSICIEPNGDVLPCQSYYVSAGNLLSDPWESIWESELFRSFRTARQIQLELIYLKNAGTVPSFLYVGLAAGSSEKPKLVPASRTWLEVAVSAVQASLLHGTD